MSCRLRLLAVALTVAVASPVTPNAHAGMYTVRACSEGGGAGQNNLFSASGLYHGGCTSGMGLWADVRAPAAVGSDSSWQMPAPAGTTISGFALGYFSEWTGGGYGSQVDGAGFFAGPCLPGLSCGWLTSQPSYASYGWKQLSRSGLSIANLRLVSFCTVAGSCPSGWVHSFFSDIGVDVSDPSNPNVALTSGQPLAGTWVRGSRTLGYTASDNSGIRRTRLQVDAAVASDDARGCDFSRPVPCSSATGSYAVDTAQLGDGARTVAVEARDATDSNSASASVTLSVDNHAPAAPAVAVDGGESARAAPVWTVRWTNPAAQAAPVALARYRVCRSGGGSCTTGSSVVPGAGGGSSQANSITGGFGVSSPGDYTLELWLEDAAGNADGSKPSPAVHLRYEVGSPGAAQPQEGERWWIGGAEATTHRVPIAMAAGASVPGSGIAGYAVTTDGSVPGTSVNAPGATAEYGPPAGGWPGGTVAVRARAISQAGVASTQVGQTTLHVDRVNPTTRSEGEGGDWQPGPVTVRLIARDEEGGSGMGVADGGDPVEAGGHIAYTLDTGTLEQVAGDEADVVLTGNGVHSIVFRAYDVAGNVSADRVVTVRVGDPLDAPAFTGAGFWAAARNPHTTFTAAAGFAASCPAEATLAPSRDAYVDQAQPDTAFGHGSGLVVRSAVTANARALLGFALPAAAGCELRSARLRLFSTAGGAGAGRQLVATRLGSSWDEDVTWRSRPGPAGPGASGSDSGGGSIEFDVTEQARAMYRVGDDGLVVHDAGEGGAPSAGTTFGSGEGVQAERPQLVVSFG